MIRPAGTTSRGLLAACALAVTLTACGDSSTSRRACGPIVREALDPAYLVHVVGDEADVSYGSEPPTSGPHQSSPAAAGAVSGPLTRPVQVGVLERGDVLIQHLPDAPAEEREGLDALVDDHVVVAPNPDLPTRIVATAWTAKRSCDALDVAALQEFIDERVGKGPED